MFGMTLGMLVESSVAVLLAVTIGYCVILNHRLKRLHADRDTLREMVTDLVQATNLANAAVKELKTAALEADMALGGRLQEAERFGLELANHVSAGSHLIERISRITNAAKGVSLAEPKEAAPEPIPVAKTALEQNRLQSALQQLAMRPGIGGRAA